MRLVEIRDELFQEVEFLASMTNVSIETVVENAMENHLNKRSDLPEFKVQIRRHIDKQAQIAARLHNRTARGMTR